MVQKWVKKRAWTKHKNTQIFSQSWERGYLETSHCMKLQPGKISPLMKWERTQKMAGMNQNKSQNVTKLQVKIVKSQITFPLQQMNVKTVLYQTQHIHAQWILHKCEVTVSKTYFGVKCCIWVQLSIIISYTLSPFYIKQLQGTFILCWIWQPLWTKAVVFSLWINNNKHELTSTRYDWDWKYRHWAFPVFSFMYRSFW